MKSARLRGQSGGHEDLETVSEENCSIVGNSMPVDRHDDVISHQL